ncbi:hypothetical protein WME90_35125 [Sorangium sp. So ce375]
MRASALAAAATRPESNGHLFSGGRGADVPTSSPATAIRRPRLVDRRGGS